MKRTSSALVFALLVAMAVAAPASASFGIAEFTVTARNADGTIDELAASHPFSLDFHLAMNTDPEGQPEGTLRTMEIDLPPGLLGNAPGVPRCSPRDFEGSIPRCPGTTQVGVLRGIVTGLGQITAPVYNLAPSPGEAATFGVAIGGVAFTQRLSLGGSGAGSSVRLFGLLPPDPAIVDVKEEIWGVPSDPGHDPARVCQTAGGGIVEGCPSEAARRPLLTLPAACDEPMRTTLTATSDGPTPSTAVATAPSRDAGGNPRPLVGCEAVPFDPGLSVGTEAAPLAPTALLLAVEVPQYEGSEQTAAASVSGLRVELPAGVTLNPSAGSWLTERSRIGSVRMQTPLIDHTISGAIYLDASSAGQVASGYAIELAIDDPQTGTSIRIPAHLEADPADGRITATIDDLPRFAFRKIEIEFDGGPRAPLTNPPVCGTFTSTATFTPSTAPFGPVVTRGAAFILAAGANGGACPPPEAERNAAPSFAAGVAPALAGGDSPLTIQLSRGDSDQHFGAFDLVLPPGLVANLGSTPVGTAVGSVVVAAGLGPSPVRLGGTAYLGGPYRGAPYSLELLVPAKAGPFDLGTIVERVALRLDPAKAQVSLAADPLPTILAGVPLEIRSLRVDVDRPGFIRNPTSCEPMAIAGTATTSLGQTTPVSDRFQVGGCATLPFKPKAALRFSGSLRRNGHPALRAVLRLGADEAAISSAGFSLPRRELLDLRHLRGLCAQDTAPELCPGSSRLGRLRLASPLLDRPAVGSVYLVAPSLRLPELLAEVRSGDLRFVLRGRVAIRKGRFGISFPAIPDIPLSRVELSLAGGRRGLLVNSRSLCGGVGEAVALLGAHSGKRRELRIRPRISGHCRSA